MAVLAAFVTPVFVLPLPAPWLLRQSGWSLRRRRMLPDTLVIVLAHDGVARLIAVVAAMKFLLLVLNARIPIA